MDLVFATNNKGKIVEIQALLKDTAFHVLSLADVGLEIDVVEDGTTYAENAFKKASEVMKRTNKLVLADDSGLEVDYLEKRPGVLSARFLGEEAPQKMKNDKIVELLRGVSEEKRTARFVSVIAAVFPDGRVLYTEGFFEGTIAHESRGDNGFGYDPIFFVPQFNKTAAELSLAQKNECSHRGKALQLMKEKLTSVIQ